MEDDAGTRLWLPPLALAGCVRAVMLRDTRGRGLPPEARDNYFPATPLVSLIWWFQGRSEWLATPGFSTPAGEEDAGAVLLAGPSPSPPTPATMARCTPSPCSCCRMRSRP